ncbi:tRNA pseudouridine synthase A [[Eubacterium] yurii subsp. margaretiae ATCC 43715]|nr:tRNA pseudouridine synthase A [[Eubacterium] yurii subsp. margaretiae ATCC 43715]
MRNILLEISYDGTNYSGWQRQKNAISIQEKIEDAISLICNEEINVIASGRTDAGVHALSQIANFSTSSSIDAKKFAKAINTKLPDDIRILSSKEVDEDFNARFSAKKKTYIYHILNREIKNPFWDKYSMHINRKLDLELMKSNSNMLIGTHDFTSFYTYEENNPKNTIKTIYSSDIVKIYEDILTFSITGDGFLYNMVRIIVGTLIEIGLHQKNDDISQILMYKDRIKAGATAKAKGLFLKNVEY